MELYDFSKANIGDAVTCMLKGKGIITSIGPILEDYPIKVEFDNERVYYYTRYGFYFKVDNIAMLYPGNVEFMITTTEACPYEVGEEIRVRDSKTQAWTITKFRRFRKNNTFPIEDQDGIIWMYHDKLVPPKK